jgi:phage tail-like protein
MKYDQVTLTRAMTKTDSAKVARWLSGCVDQSQGGTARITLKDAHNEEVATWSLRNVLPSSWKGPSLNAKDGSTVAVETLVLAHEGFL